MAREKRRGVGGMNIEVEGEEEVEEERGNGTVGAAIEWIGVGILGAVILREEIEEVTVIGAGVGTIIVGVAVVVWILEEGGLFFLWIRNVNCRILVVAIGSIVSDSCNNVS